MQIQRLSMKKKNALSVLIYIFGPVILYIIVNELAAESMDYIWKVFLQEKVLQGTGMVDSRTILPVWSFLRLVLPAGVGCLAVRRQAGLEWQAFPAAQKKRRIQASLTGRNEESGLRPFVYAAAGEEIRKSVTALLLPSTVFLALGVNVLFSVFMPDTVSQSGTGSLPSLPGTAGILLQAFVYGFFMPFIEETVFRGILYPRLQRWYGTGIAVLASALFFGLYHGNVPQAVYAVIMGILFAAAYEASGSFRVPCSLHGACNLCILLLQWTQAYGTVCRPAWGAAFLGIAAGGFLTIGLIIKKTAV